jgi:hypothetical protein
MATEYQLSYTANEIDERLGKIDKAVLYTNQVLTDEQKAQARQNIGAASEASAEHSAELAANAVSYKNSQSLTEEEKTQAR